MTDVIAPGMSAASVPTLALVVTLAAIGIVYLTARAVLLGVGPRPGSSARVLFAGAVAPTAAAVTIGVGIVLPGFLRFEPHHEGEPAGVLLIALAAIGAWHMSRVIVRAIGMLGVSHGLTRHWTISAAPLADARWGVPAYAIDAGFPLVAVAGLLRPRLFVDRRVLATCSPGELDAIAAHEHAHVRGRDNLRRLLIGACAGPASITAKAWREAAERSADLHAATSAQGAVDLAGALLKVARLAPPRTLDSTALSTIYDGGSLEARIRYLLALDAPGPPRHQSALTPLLLLSILTGIAVAWSPLLRSAHRLTEAAVQYLP
jgi:Zn-dependent protease with chaperone function